MIGTRAPRTIPAEFRLQKKGQVLRKHIAGFEIRHDKNLRPTSDSRVYSLDPSRFGIDGVIKGERAIQDAAGNLSAIGHLAQCSRIDRRRNFRGHRFNSGKNCHPRRSKANLGEEINRVLHDVVLCIEVRKNVDSGVGYKKRLRVARHVHHEHVTDAPLRPQAGT